MRICMIGACGRMGRRILDLAAGEGIAIGAAVDVAALEGTEIVAGADSKAPQRVRVISDLGAGLAASDVAIDFTGAGVCVEHVQAAVAAGKPVVVGTTGLSAEQRGELAGCVGAVAVVYAPNMSMGVNLLFKLVADVSRTLGLDYNVEVTEIHHNQKQDSPSGTAVRLAECAASGLGLVYGESVVHGRAGLVGKRGVKEIGMHAIRGGDVVGEHTVHFFGPGERIELTHKAHSRDNFARGALRAARFAVSAGPGLYDMQDVLGLK